MKHNNITVSVVIPAYNSEQFIANAIDSVLAQSYPVQEIIIVNDCSVDKTVEVASAYGSSVKIINNTQNLGASKSRNVGIKTATGEYIAFLDADDIWLPGKISAQLDTLKMSKCEIVCTHSKLVDEKDFDAYLDNKLDVQARKDCTYSVKRLNDIFENPYVSTSTLLISKNIVRRLIGFREDLKTAEDIDFCLRAALYSDFAFIEEVQSITRRVPNSLGSSLDSYQDNITVVKEFIKEFPEAGIPKETIHRVEKKIYEDWLANLVFLRKTKEAFPVALRCIISYRSLKSVKLTLKLCILALLSLKKTSP